MAHLGDFDTSTVVYGKFTTYQPSTGAAFTLGGTPALSVYKDNSTTQSTTGVTLTASFDSVTGLNHFAIDTSADGTFYSAGSFFDVVITTGTVDSVSVVGSVVGSFTLRKNSSLKPTTAGRALDVSAGGEAGIDWANIGSPTTAVNLSATNIDVDQVVASVSGAVGSVATGGITAASFAADAITAAKIAADVTTELQSGLATAASLATVAGYLDTEVAAILAAVDTEVAAIKAVTDALPDAGALTSLATQASVNTIDDFLDTEIAAIKAKTDQLTFTTANQVDCTAVTIGAGAITASAVATGAIDADALALDAVNEIADGILDRNMATGTDSGSTTVRTPRQALRALRNKVSIAAGTATITKEDDTTSSWTAAVTTTAGDPISSIDPAGP